MNPEKYHRINSILEKIFDACEHDREVLIRDHCLGDVELEQEIRRLLELDSSSQEHLFMNDDAISDARKGLEELLDNPPPPEHPMEMIGEYRVLHEIGRGGMGIVYECEQQSPKRRVAVKVVESLLHARELNQRLAAEAQIQGQLQHPGIARVYEAGVAHIGRIRRPYFVMELVAGRPLHAFATTHKLSQRERVELIARVCDGMMHAHERGIIHRDLKPENILVEKDGQPKILDFGIARFVGDSTLAATTMTREGQILGTLAYMAPEQLTGKPDLITARSDVYAIGAIMYELLLGYPPFQLEGMSISAAFRAIETENPARIRRLNRDINTDFETIAMRCLQREPKLRFANAGEVADDLRRAIADRPILSRPPTKRYRAGKFVKRNKLLVGGVSATVLALTIGFIFSVYFAAGQHAARLVAEDQQRIARAKELDAIRGVLEGTIALTDQGEVWKGVELLYTIAPDSRGWEWEHLASSLPWIQEQQTVFRSNQPRNHSFYPIGFAEPHTALEYNNQSNAFQYNNLLTDIRSPSILNEVESIGSGRFLAFQNGLLYFILDDGLIHPYNPENAEKLPALSENITAKGQYLRQISPDHQIAVMQSGDLVYIYEDSQLVFELKSGLPNNGQMQWNAPIIDQANHSIYLLTWNNHGEIIAIDTNTWEIRARKSLNASGPSAVLSPDGSILYANTDTQGIIKLNTTDLSPIGFIDETSGMIDLIIMTPDESKLIATLYDQKQIRVYDRVSEQPLITLDNGTNAQSNLFVSPDSEILFARTPTDLWPWIIPLDPDKQIDFTAPNINLLEGHNSWVYQLAVSPDGSLLASAEPQGGDILLWNLNTDQLIARLNRPNSNDLLVFYMNGPLVFDKTGTKLTYAQHKLDTDLGTNTLGLTTVDLQSGKRSWIQTASQDQTIDAAADIIGQGTIHHHASALPDGRILQASASVGYSDPVRVRGRVGSTTQPIELQGNTAGLTAGVAVHPDGSVYASGEYQMTRIYDAQTDELLHEFRDGIDSTIYGMTYSPDGSRLAMGLENGSVLIFDTQFYKLLANIKVPRAEPESQNPRNYIFNLIWTPDSKRLITAGGRVLRILESERRYLRKPQPLSAPALDLIEQIQSWSNLSATDQ